MIHIDGHASSAEMRLSMRGRSDTILLSFSGGKDSLAAWIVCRNLWSRIVPYYLYLVPELGFVERSLCYFEERMETHIIRLPHPSLYRMLANAVFQPPDRLPVLEAARIPQFSYDDLRQVVCEDIGLPLSTMVATGVRAADSPTRRINFAAHGSVNERRCSFAAIWDWTKSEVLAEIRNMNFKLPVDYEMFGRSFDGLKLGYLAPIAERFPDDYARILDWFPLARLEFLRYEKAPPDAA